jgi:hypothetical protein
MFFEIKKRLGKKLSQIEKPDDLQSIANHPVFGSLTNGVDDLENFTSEMEWSFLFPSGSPVFFQIGTVTYQHRLRFRWRGFMYEFLPLIRKARTRCDLCRALHDFARLRLTSQCLPAGNYGWRKCIQRGCLKNTSSVSF